MFTRGHHSMSTFCVSQNGTQVTTLLNSQALFLHANRDCYAYPIVSDPK